MLYSIYTLLYVMPDTNASYNSVIKKNKCHIHEQLNDSLVIHALDISTAGNAILLCGGVPFASCVTLESVCSTLRLMPATLGSGESGGDIDLTFLSCEGGGVDRKPFSVVVIDWTSGVAERLP